jgi:hypothetical protein
MLNLSGWNLNTPKLQIGKPRSRAVKTMRYFAVAFVMLLGSEVRKNYASMRYATNSMGVALG